MTQSIDGFFPCQTMVVEKHGGVAGGFVVFGIQVFSRLQRGVRQCLERLVFLGVTAGDVMRPGLILSNRIGQRMTSEHRHGERLRV